VVFTTELFLWFIAIKWLIFEGNAGALLFAKGWLMMSAIKRFPPVLDDDHNDFADLLAVH